MNQNAALDELGLERMIDLFYERVRADPELGPVFNDAVKDWPDHLHRMVGFWSSVMLASGRYKGNPMMAHFRLSSRLTPAMFIRWLTLWRATAAEVMPPAAAAALSAKADRIAKSLQLALAFRPDVPLEVLRAAA